MIYEENLLFTDAPPLRPPDMPWVSATMRHQRAPRRRATRWMKSAWLAYLQVHMSANGVEVSSCNPTVVVVVPLSESCYPGEGRTLQRKVSLG